MGLSSRATLFGVLLFLGVTGVLQAASTVRGDLPRGADLGFGTETSEDGLVVARTVPGSAAAR